MEHATKDLHRGSVLMSRYLGCLVLGICLFLAGCKSQSNFNETPEAVGEGFFKALSSNDSEVLKLLFPEGKDWESMAKLKEVPEEERENFKVEFERRIEMANTNEISRFKILQDRAEEKSLVMKDAELVEVVKVKEWNDAGLDMANVEVRFKLADQAYTILLGNIGRLDRGWFLNRVPNWKP